MTDISKEAVERICWWLGDGGDGEEVQITRHHSRTSIEALRALSARVEELEEHIADMLQEQSCACGYDNPSDICLGHLPRYKRDVKAARLQGLGEAARVRSLIKLALDQEQGCGGRLSPKEVMRNMQEILRDALRAIEGER